MLRMIVKTISLLGILILLEIISFNQDISIDCSVGKKYTFSEQTVSILKSLKCPIKFTTFSDNKSRRDFQNLFQRISNYSPLIKYELLDLDRSPGIANLRGITAYGQTIVEGNKKTEKIEYPSERYIVNAILRLTSNKIRTVYFMKGHEEHHVSDSGKLGFSQISIELDNDGWQINEITTGDLNGIDVPNSIVVIAGPRTDFVYEELQPISNYLQKGGKVIFMLEPKYLTPRLDNFLGKYNFLLTDDIIIDDESKLYGGDYFTILAYPSEKHPITRNLSQQYLFSTVRSIQYGEYKEPQDFKSLAVSGQYSWAIDIKGAFKEDFEFEKMEGLRGPISVVGLSESKDESEVLPKNSFSIVCFGDSDFIANYMVERHGNRDLFLNTVSWLFEEEELTFERPRQVDYKYHALSLKEEKTLFVSFVIILPAIFVILGLVLFFNRRKD